MQTSQTIINELDDAQDSTLPSQWVTMHIQKNSQDPLCFINSEILKEWKHWEATPPQHKRYADTKQQEIIHWLINAILMTENVISDRRNPIKHKLMHQLLGQEKTETATKKQKTINEIGII